MKVANTLKPQTDTLLVAWVEGQDVDCENDASGTDVTFNIKFTKVA